MNVVDRLRKFGPLSESKTLEWAVEELQKLRTDSVLSGYRKARLSEVITELSSLLYQARKGVHRNPALVVFNPPRSRRHRRNPSEDGIIASDVQAILYKHHDDGRWYCHGFGGKDPDIKSRGDSVTLTGLAETTGVVAAVEDDGKVVSLYHRDGKPIAEDI